MADAFSSLDKQIAEIEAGLRLIDERLSEFVSPTDPANLQFRQEAHARLEDLRKSRQRRSERHDLAGIAGRSARPDRVTHPA